MAKFSGILLVGAFLVSACGSGASTQAPTVKPTGSTAATASAAASATAGASGSTAAGGALAALATTKLGMVLVGANGHTLYGFTPDVDAGKPTCYDTCAANWPPVTVSGDFTVGAGLDQSKFKLVPRTDGTQQLQIGDYPLYFFTPDKNAGDVNGQGKQGIWFVVDANGNLITATPSGT